MVAAVTDAYATAAEYRAIVTKSDTSQDTALDTDLATVSRYIEKRMGGRFFTKDAAAVARIFYPRYAGRELDLDDIGSTSGLAIKVDSSLLGSFSSYSAWAATDYQLKPLNAASGPEANPYTSIYVPPWSTQPWFTPQVPVQVTAIWGWPAVPGAIKRACIELTAILRYDSPRATQRVNEVGDVLQQSAEAERIVWSLWDSYRGRITL